jgi:hypothetical protein
MSISIWHCADSFTDSAGLLSQHGNPVTLPTRVWLNQTLTHGQSFRNTRALYKVGHTSVCHSPASQAETPFHFDVNQMWSVVVQISLKQNSNHVFISALAIILCTIDPYSFIPIIIEVDVTGLSDDTVKQLSRTWHLTFPHIAPHSVLLCSIVFYCVLFYITNEGKILYYVIIFSSHKMEDTRYKLWKT